MFCYRTLVNFYTSQFLLAQVYDVTLTDIQTQPLRERLENENKQP